MKTMKSGVICILLVTILASCKSEQKETPTQAKINKVESAQFIDVVALDFTFTVDDTIPSGWSTFRMKNTGMMDHFFLLTKLPDTVTLDDYIRGVGGAFGVAWEAIKANKTKGEAFALLGGALPEWYSSTKAMGGAGLISKGQVAINTLKLEPGDYIMECYIKTESGQFHTELGMIRSLVVSKKHTPAIPPKANAEVRLKNADFKIDGVLNSGKNIIAVHFEEQPEFGLGNDIHIVKLKANTNLDEVAQWMDWSNLTGMVSPGPNVFVGGTQEMPVGYTAYFECDLEPGDYAFIAEVPVGRYERFTIK